MRPGQHTDKFKRKFIEKSRKRFGDQFAFEKVVYTTSATKVMITCASTMATFALYTWVNLLHQTFGCRVCANKEHARQDRMELVTRCRLYRQRPPSSMA